MRTTQSHRLTGLSLVELLTVMSIISIVTAFATPSFVGLIQKFRLMGEATALSGALANARSEAIRQGVKVTVCVSTDGVNCATGETNWLAGWMIYAAPIAAPTSIVKLRVQNKWKSSDKLAATGLTPISSVDFNRDGFLTGSGGNALAFQADTVPPNPAARHCVKLFLTGHREVTNGACS